MKKLPLPLVLAAGLFATAAAMAAEPVNNTAKLAKLASLYSFEVGLTAHHEVYKETTSEGAKFMQETTNLYGVKGAVSRSLGERSKVQFSAEYAYGHAKYVGAYQDGNYGDLEFSGMGRWLFESTAVYRYSPPTWGGLALHGGLGFRQLVDNMQEAGPAGYQRTNKRIYGIAGVEKAFQTEGWSITPVAEYKVSLWSRHESDLGSDILVHHQHGYGEELSVAFATKATRYPVSVRPFVRTWHMDKSNEVQYGDYLTNEPKNDTTEVGADLSWHF